MTIKKRETASVHTDRSVWRRFEKFWKGRRFGPTILDRYILMEILPPFIVALLFWTTLFMSLVLQGVAGELFGKGIEITKILTYLGFLIGEKLTQTVPMSCLFGGIMAAGRLSGDSEITAMRCAGISFPRIYTVYIFTGIVSLLAVAWMNLYYGPVNSRAREDFEDWLKAYHSLSLVKPGAFLGRANIDGISKKGQDIYAENKIGNILYEVQIREWYNGLNEKSSEVVSIRGFGIPIGDGFVSQIVHAKTGEMLSRRSETGLEEKFLRLRNGFLIELDEKQTRYQITDFSDGFMDYVIPPPVRPLGRLNVRPDNYTFPELFDFLKKLDEGGNEIDVGALLPGIGPSEGSVKLGEGGGGSTIRLPPLAEMKTSVIQFQFWLTQNYPLIGKQGGPTQEEFQQRVQLSLQFSAFLKDAEKTKKRFQVEIQKRLAMPVACLLFFFISFPLGLVVKRSGKGMSFALALVVFLIYYTFLNIGLSRADQGKLHPFVGAWTANFVILGMGIWIMSTRTEGFSPLYFLIRPFHRVWKKLSGAFLRVVPLDRAIQAMVYRLKSLKMVVFLDRYVKFALKKFRS